MFRALFFLLLGAFLSIRYWYGRRAGLLDERVRPTVEAVAREGRFSLMARLALSIWFLAAALVYAVRPDWLARFAIPIPHAARWAGVALGAMSLVFLGWVHAALGRFWSTNLQLRQGHALVTDGPYRRIAHPMYTALFAFMIALTLVSANWMFAVPVAAAIVLFARRIPREEAMMAAQFGEAYHQYRARTGRLLPPLPRDRGEDDAPASR